MRFTFQSVTMIFAVTAATVFVLNQVAARSPQLRTFIRGRAVSVVNGGASGVAI